MKRTCCTFHWIYWESRASTCFEQYLLILRRCNTNSIWYTGCICQLAVVRLQFHCNRTTANCQLHARIIPDPVFSANPEDEQVIFETCRGFWFSINWMKSASRWFHCTDYRERSRGSGFSMKIVLRLVGCGRKCNCSAMKFNNRFHEHWNGTLHYLQALEVGTCTARQHLKRTAPQMYNP
jgi:hypothetical protein